MSKEFSSKKSENKESVEESLKKNTIGLVHLDEFKLKRKQIEEQAARDAAGTSSSNTRPKKKSKTKKSSAKLSFADGDIEDGDDVDSDNMSTNKKKLSKNPQVDTSFLPDRERDLSEISQRELLRIEFLEKQEQIKSETIDVKFAYFDGTSHMSTLTCKKGDTLTHLLDKSRQKFAQLKQNHVDNLMIVKHNLILPTHYTFYDFQVNQTRSRQGELFDFADSETAAKVVERSWYHNNKHIFPASKWEQFETTPA
ncbi:hypothetical protein E3P99_00528 [Wallemia hederae]|uniref:FAM50A/XAP5 C-terminal domain-containing protein n=1 Tax=Wallemia hederae TaxID=1540922 RepID=A0A4T0FWS4_9BASI|nr:hypothetical protein E3P99_00528 [Wallemia hederae]